MTNEEFDLKMKDSEFKRVGEYINSKTSIKLECRKCGREYNIYPKELNKIKCKSCERGALYREYLKDSDTNIELIGEYTNIRAELEHKCIKCNETFINSPRNIQRLVNPCPNCSTFRMTLEEYKDRLPIDIECISEEFNGTTHRIPHKCLKCDHIWNPKPNYILHSKTGCPVCNSSKGERKINNILLSYSIEYIREYSVNVDNQSYRFDFYLPKENTLIEHDGIQHFESIEYFGGDEAFKLIQEGDNTKNIYCKDNNINLIRIKYDEDDDFILDKLNHILSKYNKVKDIIFEKEEEVVKVKKEPKEVKIISLEDIVSVPGRLTEKYILRYRPDIHQEVLDYTDYDICFKEKLWYFYYKVTSEQLCKCGNKTTFNKKFTDGYKESCSTQCAQSLSSTKANRKKTVLEKYSTTNVAKNKDIQKKIEETNMERYGTKSTFQNEEVRAKWTKNVQDKYGVDHVFQLDSVKKKSKDTMDERYGDYFTRTEEYKEKSIATNLEKYGKEWNTQTEEYKEKANNARNKKK